MSNKTNTDCDARLVEAIKRHYGTDTLTMPMIRPLAYTAIFERLVAECYGRVPPEQSHLKRGWTALVRAARGQEPQTAAAPEQPTTPPAATRPPVRSSSGQMKPRRAQ